MLSSRIFGLLEPSYLHPTPPGTRFLQERGPVPRYSGRRPSRAAFSWLPATLGLGVVVLGIAWPTTQATAVEVFSSVEMISHTPPLKGVTSWTIEGRRHRGGIRSVAYGPQGNWVATGGADGTVRIWTRQQVPVAILTGHLNVVLSVAWSSDGKYLASSDATGEIRVWDPRSGKCVQNKSVEPHLVQQLSWAPEGHLLAAAHQDACLRVWNAETGAIAWSVDELGSSVDAVAWAPNGRWLACSFGDGTVGVFDCTTQARIRTFQVAGGNVHSLAWSPDSRALASLSGLPEESVRLWDPTSGSQLRQLAQAVGRMAWAPNGKLLATANHQKFRLWDSATGTMVREVANPRGTGIDCLAWSADSQELAAGDNVGSLWFWNGKMPAPVNPYPPRNGPVDIVSNLAFSRDSTRLAFGLHDHLVIWDLASCQCRPIPGLNWTEAIDWHPSGRVIAAGGSDNVLHLLDLQPGQKPREIRSGYEVIRNLAWSPDGRRILVRDSKSRVWIEDAVQGRTVQALAKPEENWNGFSAWSPDGTRLANSGMAHIWDLRAGRMLQDCNRFLTWIAWSPDGRTLAGAEQTFVGLMPVNGEAEVSDLTTSLPFTATLAWTDGGKTIGAACWEKVMFWEASTRNLLREATLDPVLRNYALYYLSPDGRHVAGPRREDGTIRLYDASSGELRRVFAFFTERNYAVFTPEGNYVATPGAEKELVAAVATEQGPQVLGLADFSNKHRWKNNPQKVLLKMSRSRAASSR